MAYAEVSEHHGSAKACVAVSSQRNYYYYLVLRNTRQASFRRHKTGKAGLDILARSGTRALPFHKGFLSSRRQHQQEICFWLSRDPCLAG